MFVVTVHFEIRPGHETEFGEAVREQARTSVREEPACRQFDVCLDPAKPAEAFLYELYASAAAFDAHTRTAHFARFGARTAPWVERKIVRTWQRVEQ
jgi:(4S)-4-hydroxy-5-phosphonooxypentane-2,3-dione isomerase